MLNRIAYEPNGLGSGVAVAAAVPGSERNGFFVARSSEDLITGGKASAGMIEWYAVGGNTADSGFIIKAQCMVIP